MASRRISLRYVLAALLVLQTGCALPEVAPFPATQPPEPQQSTEPSTAERDDQTPDAGGVKSVQDAQVSESTTAGTGGNEATAPPPVTGATSGLAGTAAMSAAAGSGTDPMMPAVQCLSGACAPNGSCISTGDDYSCVCKPDFSGSGTKSCKKVDDCLSHACGPGGTCVDGIDTYSCNCDPGYSGTGTKSCSNINECSPGACQPGGTCIDGINGFTCECEVGYTGTGTTRCTLIDNCPPDACSPGGTCVTTINNYTCECEEPDYYGDGTGTCNYHCLKNGGCAVGDRCRTSSDCYPDIDCVNGICIGACRPNCLNNYRCTSDSECDSGYCNAANLCATP